MISHAAVANLKPDLTMNMLTYTGERQWSPSMYTGYYTHTNNMKSNSRLSSWDTYSARSRSSTIFYKNSLLSGHREGVWIYDNRHKKHLYA